MAVKIVSVRGWAAAPRAEPAKGETAGAGGGRRQWGVGVRRMEQGGASRGAGDYGYEVVCASAGHLIAVVGGQWSVVSGQWSVSGCGYWPLATDHRPLARNS